MPIISATTLGTRAPRQRPDRPWGVRHAGPIRRLRAVAAPQVRPRRLRGGEHTPRRRSAVCRGCHWWRGRRCRRLLLTGRRAAGRACRRATLAPAVVAAAGKFLLLLLLLPFMLLPEPLCAIREDPPRRGTRSSGVAPGPVRAGPSPRDGPWRGPRRRRRGHTGATGAKTTHCILRLAGALATAFSFSVVVRSRFASLQLF